MLAAVVATITLVAASMPAQANAFRCGTRVISRGDHASKVLELCGEPDSVQTRLAQRTFTSNYGRIYLPGFVEDVLVEEWTYNLGPHKLMRLVRVENGFVREIRHLGYGYSPR
jgi:Protein of unknown function (DUF2845)